VKGEYHVGHPMTTPRGKDDSEVRCAGRMTSSRSTQADVVHTFAPRRDGPEAELQDIVSEALHDVVGFSGDHVWTGSYLPVGAGAPDLLAVQYKPQVETIASLSSTQLSIVTYLRSVTRARLETIASRVASPVLRVSTCVEDLLRIQVICRIGHSFRLHDEWRNVLLEVVAIEVKISDWRRGAQQAARNLLFSNRSFLALPIQAAQRANRDEFVSATGLGIIGIDDEGALHVVRRPRRHSPKVWSYYYAVAKAVATSNGSCDAVRVAN